MVMRRNYLMNNPQEEFRVPERIVEDQELTDEQKISLLMNWRQDLIELQQADAENMQRTPDDSGDIAAQLGKVTDALKALGADPRTGRHR